MKQLMTAVILGGSLFTAAFTSHAGPVLIPGGEFNSPVLLDVDNRVTQVSPFLLDAAPVTRAQYASFVAQHPSWQRNTIAALFHDGGYLANWAHDDSPSDNEAMPVTFVSWFAARAYCQAQGGHLPTLEQWEYAVAYAREQAGLSDDDYARQVFAWYSQTPFTSRASNANAMLGLLGEVNEWLEDYQLLLSNGEQIDFGGGSCGDTARLLASFDAAHYATFLRYQSRSGYAPVTTTSTLGFRCAYSLE